MHGGCGLSLFGQIVLRAQVERRGRKSSAALSLILPKDVRPAKRPKAPSYLTKEHAEEWNAVVDRMPADWFPRETHGVLAQYCYHVVESRRVSGLIAQMTSRKRYDLDQYEQLLRIRDKEGRAASMLATRMRLTQQSRYDKKRKTGNVVAQRPWQEED